MELARIRVSDEHLGNDPRLYMWCQHLVPQEQFDWKTSFLCWLLPHMSLPNMATLLITASKRENLLARSAHNLCSLIMRWHSITFNISIRINSLGSFTFKGREFPMAWIPECEAILEFACHSLEEASLKKHFFFQNAYFKSGRMW